MKAIFAIYFIAFAANLSAAPIMDDSDPYPYQDLVPRSFSATQAKLSLNFKVRNKGNKSHLEAQIIIYNNTNQDFQMEESNVFLDFQFEVRTDENELMSPNDMLKEIIATRDEFIHSDEVLLPKQGRKYFLKLSKIYDFKSGKTYKVTVSRTLKGSMSGVLKLTSAPVQFTAL